MPEFRGDSIVIAGYTIRVVDGWVIVRGSEGTMLGGIPADGSKA